MFVTSTNEQQFDKMKAVHLSQLIQFLNILHLTQLTFLGLPSMKSEHYFNTFNPHHMRYIVHI